MKSTSRVDGRNRSYWYFSDDTERCLKARRNIKKITIRCRISDLQSLRKSIELAQSDGKTFDTSVALPLRHVIA